MSNVKPTPDFSAPAASQPVLSNLFYNEFHGICAVTRTKAYLQPVIQITPLTLQANQYLQLPEEISLFQKETSGDPTKILKTTQDACLGLDLSIYCMSTIAQSTW
jgi:hypothetical protein